MFPKNLKIQNCQNNKLKTNTFKYIIRVASGTSAARSFSNTDLKLQDFMASRTILLFRQILKLKTLSYIFLHNALRTSIKKVQNQVLEICFCTIAFLHHIFFFFSLEQSPPVPRQNATRVWQHCIAQFFHNRTQQNIAPGSSSESESSSRTPVLALAQVHFQNQVQSVLKTAS